MRRALSQTFDHSRRAPPAKAVTQTTQFHSTLVFDVILRLLVLHVYQKTAQNAYLLLGTSQIKSSSVRDQIGRGAFDLLVQLTELP